MYKITLVLLLLNMYPLLSKPNLFRLSTTSRTFSTSSLKIINTQSCQYSSSSHYSQKQPSRFDIPFEKTHKKSELQCVRTLEEQFLNNSTSSFDGFHTPKTIFSQPANISPGILSRFSTNTAHSDAFKEFNNDKKTQAMIERLVKKIQEEEESPSGDTIFCAVEINDSELIAQYLHNGGDITITNNFGDTLLHTAVYVKNFGMVQFLIQHKAPVNATCKMGETPLHEAVRSGNIEIVRLLLLNKANPNLQDNNGATPLHFAASRGDSTMIVLLQKYGANYRIKNNKGITPKDIVSKIQLK